MFMSMIVCVFVGVCLCECVMVASQSHKHPLYDLLISQLKSPMHFAESAQINISTISLN